jgi:hypothetical protein
MQLMLTAAASRYVRLQAFSQGWGHTLPVTAGKGIISRENFPRFGKGSAVIEEFHIFPNIYTRGTVKLAGWRLNIGVLALGHHVNTVAWTIPHAHAAAYAFVFIHNYGERRTDNVRIDHFFESAWTKVSFLQLNFYF